MEHEIIIVAPNSKHSPLAPHTLVQNDHRGIGAPWLFMSSPKSSFSRRSKRQRHPTQIWTICSNEKQREHTVFVFCRTQSLTWSTYEQKLRFPRLKKLRITKNKSLQKCRHNISSCSIGVGLGFGHTRNNHCLWAKSFSPPECLRISCNLSLHSLRISGRA